MLYDTKQQHADSTGKSSHDGEAEPPWLGVDPASCPARSTRHPMSARTCKRHYAAHTFTARIDAEAWLAAERRLIELDDWTPPAARRAQKTARGVTVAEYAQRVDRPPQPQATHPQQLPGAARSAHRHRRSAPRR